MHLSPTYSGDAAEYKLFAAGRKQIIEKARQSDFRNLPAAVTGPGVPLLRPGSNQIKDTQPLNSEAGRTIVRVAKQAKVSKPLIIITGGQLTAVADAYLIDSTIIDQFVVSGIFGVMDKTYNAGLDPWAWAIVTSKFTCLSISDSDSAYNQVFKNAAALTPKSRFASALKDHRLQSNVFTDWLLSKRHPVHPISYMDRDGDSPACIPLLKSDYITKLSRWSCSGIDAAGLPVLTRDENGRIYVALAADQRIAIAEFWQAILRLR